MYSSILNNKVYSIFTTNSSYMYTFYIVFSYHLSFFPDDNRINQNPHLAILNVILLREHNRIAANLSELNPHWEDDKIFNIARTILIGMFQHISFYELMPVYVNESILYENKILYDTDGFVDDYDPEVDASTFTEFAQAAFRYGHSMVAGPLR